MFINIIVSTKAKQNKTKKRCYWFPILETLSRNKIKPSSETLSQTNSQQKKRLEEKLPL